MVSERGNEMGRQENGPGIAVFGVPDECKIFIEPDVVAKDAQSLAKAGARVSKAAQEKLQIRGLVCAPQ